MVLKQCENCGDPFEGRSNRVYCSQTCKSAVNNSRIVERDKNVRFIDQKIRTNRRILMQLHNLYGDTQLPPFVIDMTLINKKWHNGISPDGQQTYFLDYALKRLSNDYFQIIKRT